MTRGQVLQRAAQGTRGRGVGEQTDGEGPWRSDMGQGHQHMWRLCGRKSTALSRCARRRGCSWSTGGEGVSARCSRRVGEAARKCWTGSLQGGRQEGAELWPHTCPRGSVDQGRPAPGSPAPAPRPNSTPNPPGGLGSLLARFQCLVVMGCPSLPIVAWGCSRRSSE